VIQALLEKIAKARVLVAGDVMLDRYWYGAVDRISPEAPVPVVAVRNAEERPGGAANVAANVTALGANCTLLAVTGDDGDAELLGRLLENRSIHHAFHRDKLVNTTIKLRVIAQHQQLMRVDFEAPPSKDTCIRMLDDFIDRLSQHDVVIVSDYGKGGLGTVREMIAAARKANVPLVVDPKGYDYSHYRGATLLTPNRKEFEQVAGQFLDNDDFEQRARKMVADLDLQALLVTRSDEGMSLVPREGPVLHMPARAREVFDVTGAGDTVIASIAAAYAAGGAPEDALHLANIAAGIVVGKLGSATASPDEIRRELEHEEEQ
jgi:rfaE bifunctional protein kinase chain/domain